MLCKVAGAIIKNGRGWFLTAYRSKKPEGLSLPSFHLTTKFETTCLTENDLFRNRLHDDLGIKSIHIQRHPSVICEHRCRFGKPFLNITVHEWIIYEVLSFSGKPKNCRKDKYQSIGFLPARKILAALKEKQFDPVWLNIFPRSQYLKIISPK